MEDPPSPSARMRLLPLSIFAISLVFSPTVRAAASNALPGVLHRRSYFYVGGTYVPQNTSQVAHGQIYVEHLVPEKVTQPLPLLMIHGHGMTATNFLNTPDGRIGWADHFMSKGYEIYLVDQPARGRSTWQDGIDGEVLAYDTFTVESHFTATQLFKLWPQAHLHTQWPGNGTVGDPVFDDFYKSTMQSLVSDTLSSQAMQPAGAALLDIIGPAIVLTHSQAGQYGWLLGDARPSLVRAIIAVEPMGPPFFKAVFAPTGPDLPYGLTEIPLTFSPPLASPDDLHPVIVSSDPSINFTCFQQGNSPPRRLVNVATIPVLVVTSQASYHAVYDDCSVQFLREAGVIVEHVHLPDVGIFGNGHMMFMEKNNIQIAEEVVEKWIDETLD